MKVSLSRCTGTRGSASLRCAVDAQARRRHRLEAGLRDRLAARLARAVVAGVELGEGVVELGEGFGQLARDRLDLTPFGGDLPGVGEATLEAVAGEVVELGLHRVALLLEAGASRRVRGVGHGSSVPATREPQSAVLSAGPPPEDAWARGWADS